jgi:phage baseplate assembly protein W
MKSPFSRQFKDISLSFVKNPITNDILALNNEDAIKKSVLNLVKTRLGERFFNDLLGSSVLDSLFELGSAGVEIVLEKEITTLLKNFEPRVVLREVLVEIPDDSNELNIRLSYDIVGLPFPQQNIEFILQPTRI